MSMPVENGQGGITTSFQYIDACRSEIELRFGNKPMQVWTNADYLRLGKELLEQTGVAISPNTLKRIFGKLRTSARYYPQKATRDALAFYMGHHDWETFVRKQEPTAAKHDRIIAVPRAGLPLMDEISPTEMPAAAGHSFPAKKLMVAVAVVVMLLATVFVVRQAAGEESGNPATGVRLLCRNAEANAAPHSAIFSVALPAVFNGDSKLFTLAFNDSRRESPIVPGELLGHYYEMPGRYYPVLKYAGNPVDTIPVYLKTNGWAAIAIMQNDSSRVYPVEEKFLLHNGAISVSAPMLARAGIDTGRTFFVRFVNAAPISADADNFELTVDASASATRPGVRCSQINITVYGEKAMHTFAMMKPGCEVLIGAQFSEWQAMGIHKDLSALSADLTGGGILQLRVQDKKVSILIRGKKVFDAAYKQPVGKVYGVCIGFSGIGEIRSVDLTNLTNHESIMLAGTKQ